MLSQFRQHDVVLLGEFHTIRQDLLFLQRLVPQLPNAGVFVLAWEFARRVDQPRIDSLLTAAAWNETLAREIIWRQKVDWGYREYVDVLHAIWQVNRAAPKDQRRLRLLALNNDPRWELLERPEDAKDPTKWAQVWHGETEADWARVVLDSVVGRGDKVLTYSGLHHAFTHFRQPSVSGGVFQGFETRRFGNVLYNRLGGRTFLIALHAPWPDTTGYGGKLELPADGKIDGALRAAAMEHREVGFDILGSPFEELGASTAVYSRGYHRFRLGDLADGYVYLGPLQQAEGVRVIADFINEANLEETRRIADDPSLRHASLQEIRDGITDDADFPARIRRRLVLPRVRP